MKELRDPKKILNQISKTNKSDNSTSQQSKNAKMEKHLYMLLDKNKTSERLNLKESKDNSPKKAGNKTSEEETKEAKIELPKNSKVAEVYDASRNKTSKKGTSDPYWNKNSVLGLRKKHKVDYLSIKKNNRLVLANESSSEGLRMFDRLRDNSTEKEVMTNK